MNIISKILLWALVLAPHLMAQNPVTGNAHEFTASGDFDGDGREDLVYLDRETGQYRIAYQDPDGFTMSQVRSTGVTQVSCLTVGRLLDSNQDALAVTSPESNQVVVVGAGNRTQTEIPTQKALDAIGPNTLLAIDVGGTGNTPHHDLLVGSLWNDLPNNGRLSLLRADGNGFSDSGHQNHTTVEQAQVHPLVLNGPAFALMMSRGPVDDTLLAYNVQGGIPTTPNLSLSGLPMGSHYALGYFSPFDGMALVIWQPGDNRMTSYTLSQSSANQFTASNPVVQVMTEPIEHITTVPGSNQVDQLLILQDGGSSAELYSSSRHPHL